MRHHIATAVAAVLLATPAMAGTTYRSTTTIKGPQGDQVIRTEAWVEGDNAKIVFQESDNPLLVEGAYLLTTDGGRTMHLVNPEDKTYTPFDLGQLAGMAGAAMQGLGGLVKMSFTNHQVEKLAEEPGGQLHGMDTTHYRFRTSYDSEIRVMGMRQSASNEVVTDTWTTTALGDAGFGAWLQREPPKTGIADLDAIIASEIGKGITGVPLKLVSVTTSTDKKKGQVQTTSTTMEVTSLREQAVPAGSFQIPAGYEKAEMMASPFGQ